MGSRLTQLPVLMALWLAVSSAAWSAAPYRGQTYADKRPLAKLVEAPPGAQGVQVRQHWIDGLLVYEVVVGAASFDDELPLLVQIHGRASRPQLPRGDHRRAPPARLMIPRAPEPLGRGYTWFPVSVTEDLPDRVLAGHIRTRADELAPVIARFAEERPTEGRPIVSGFSQGGMLSMGLAVLHPELIDGAFPLAGWLPRELVDEGLRRQVGREASVFPPIRVINADRDPIIPVQETLATVAYMQSRGIDARCDVFAHDEHTMTGEMRRHFRSELRALIRRRRGETSGLG